MGISNEVESILESMGDDVSIATIGSHSALNIFKGAREEGLRTVCLCTPDRARLYRRFNLVDEFIILDDLKQITTENVTKRLNDLNSIIIPHGSFNAYIDQKLMLSWPVPILGNRDFLEIETSRARQHEWLRASGLKVPRIYSDFSEVDRLAFVKFEGAKGGKGYFVADNQATYEKKIRMMLKNGLITVEEAKKPYIQEYIIGINAYPHYFHSPLKDETEFLGVDKRYESSVDGVFRIPVPEQIGQEISPTFTIVGNFPMVLRESLLPDIYDIGEKIIAQSKKISAPGLMGPFCLETIIRENLEIVAFEISTRIVAGCNALIGNNPYTYVQYDEPMYMGKRIAREVKTAAKTGQLGKLVT
jgi:5-formaminoimidazole-4-carboxamide-1-(beta)-D-ribofuranosyl 5'-monophosphate synthetase